MNFDPDNPTTWPLRPPLIAHDVGHTRDRSTAVVGGRSPLDPTLLGIAELNHLEQGLFANARAHAVAQIDASCSHAALIIADLSYDPSYAQHLYDTFGPRVIGLQITSAGDGNEGRRLPLSNGSMPLYTVGRSYLIENLHNQFVADRVRMVGGEMARLAFQQLADLERELRENRVIYSCPSGRHDDLGMSCAMLAWAARHPHYDWWVQTGLAIRRPPRPKQKVSWLAWT